MIVMFYKLLTGSDDVINAALFDMLVEVILVVSLLVVLNG